MRKRQQDTGRIWSWLRGARVAALSAAAGLLFLSFAGDLEGTYGLGTLFRVRGPMPPPAGIVIAAMDRASADSLGLPPPPWPRTVHADLIRALDQRGAAAIVFDQRFTTERSAVEDQELAAALRLSGRVVLLQGLERRLSTPSSEDDEGGSPRASDSTVDPIPPLRESALAFATFPVPIDSDVLTSFWTFLSGTELPTLPAVVLQLSAADIADDWAAILKKESLGPRDAEDWTNRSLAESMTQLRGQLRDNSSTVSRLARAIAQLEPDKAKRLSTLLDLYAGGDSRQLNFFGPPWTISTIPYASIINGDEKIADLRGKIVFVGVSEREVVGQPVDTYKTPYSTRNGINLSGVEILATGVANLMDDTSLRTSGLANVATIVVIALVLGLAAASASDLILGVVSVALLLAIPMLAYVLFVSANFVAPVLTPFAVQLPIGILTIGLSLKSAERKLRRGLESAAREFLPREVADRLALGPLSPSAMPASRMISAIFLATDVKGFTTLAERLSPETLDELAKDYFGPLFESVARHRGDILNMTADSMMCAWDLGDDPARARGNAIAAALNMARLVEDFATRHPSTPMPTRFGLRAGTAAFGVVGHSGRYVTTVVGDVTNTASRIDSLNKLLGTTVLASAEVLANIEGLVLRPLGLFAPVGKAESVEVVEILGYGGEDQKLTALAGAFCLCIAVFDDERWIDAAIRFSALHDQYPDDGPTSFFRDLAERYSLDPPPPGTARPIRVSIK
jgi:adenylate cyclase